MSTATTEAPAASTTLNAGFNRLESFRKLYADKDIPGIMADLQKGSVPLDIATQLITDRQTVKVVVQNMSAADFATATLLDLEGNEVKRDLTVDGQKLSAKPMRFKTGSVGYNMNGKLTLQVNGKTARFQVSGNLVLIGSKPGEE